MIMFSMLYICATKLPSLFGSFAKKVTTLSVGTLLFMELEST